jgi:hypothetical protein
MGTQLKQGLGSALQEAECWRSQCEGALGGAATGTRQGAPLDIAPRADRPSPENSTLPEHEPRARHTNSDPIPGGNPLRACAGDQGPVVMSISF